LIHPLLPTRLCRLTNDKEILAIIQSLRKSNPSAFDAFVSDYRAEYGLAPDAMIADHFLRTAARRICPSLPEFTAPCLIVSFHLELATAALEDYLDDLHQQASSAFFRSRFVEHGLVNRQEATVQNCLALLRQLPSPHTVSLEKRCYGASG